MVLNVCEMASKKRLLSISTLHDKGFMTHPAAVILHLHKLPAMSCVQALMKIALLASRSSMRFLAWRPPTLCLQWSSAQDLLNKTAASDLPMVKLITLLLLAVGVSFSAHCAEPFSQSVQQTSLTSSLHVSEVSALQHKALWATRLLTFLPIDGDADGVQLCVSDDHRAWVSHWEHSREGQQMVRETYVSASNGLRNCDVWYHAGTMASVPQWKRHLPSSALALGEVPDWFSVGGMVQVLHTGQGAQFCESSQHGLGKSKTRCQDVEII